MRTPRRFVCSGAVALGLLGVCISGEVRAQEIPCTEEVRTFCAGVPPGGGRIMQCLKSNESKLSPACTGRMNDLQETVSGPLGACRDDWVAYCYHPRVSTGRQEMTQCLQANQAKVSAGCQKALQGMGGKRGQPRGSMP
jgi:hypothetical protein